MSPRGPTKLDCKCSMLAGGENSSIIGLGLNRKYRCVWKTNSCWRWRWWGSRRIRFWNSSIQQLIRFLTSKINGVKECPYFSSRTFHELNGSDPSGHVPTSASYQGRNFEQLSLPCLSTFFLHIHMIIWLFSGNGSEVLGQDGKVWLRHVSVFPGKIGTTLVASEIHGKASPSARLTNNFLAFVFSLNHGFSDSIFFCWILQYPLIQSYLFRLR